jgi:phage baseplate assembly protein W
MASKITAAADKRLISIKDMEPGVCGVGLSGRKQQIIATMLPGSSRISRNVAALLCLALLAGCAGMPRRPPPALEQVVEMSQAGRPAEEILRELQDTRAVYPLTGSQIARLHDQGVADAVLDYLQNAYAESIRWDARLRYENSFLWHDCFYCYHRPVIVVPR